MKMTYYIFATKKRELSIFKIKYKSVTFSEWRSWSVFKYIRNQHTTVFHNAVNEVYELYILILNHLINTNGISIRLRVMEIHVHSSQFTVLKLNIYLNLIRAIIGKFIE